MDNKDPLVNIEDIDNLLSSINTDTQNINIQEGEAHINVEDVLKLTEEYAEVDSGTSNALDFLNSTQKNLQELQNIESSIKKPDILNEMLNTDIVIKKKELELKEEKKFKIPNFKNSIEFINYMENEYIESTIKKNKKIFKLQNYSSFINKKPTVLQFPNKQSLTEKIFREKNPINSISAKEDLLFTGDSMGKIKMFSIEKECEIKSFSNKEINSKVLCMDISDDLLNLLSGYSNGFIALWDLKFGRLKKLLKDQHDYSILCCKFIKYDEYTTQFISSDISGEVNKIILTQNFLYLNVSNENIIYYKTTPFYQIDVLKFNNDEKNNLNPEIIALASTEFVLLYQLNPEPKQIYKIHRPLYFSKSYIPDISFGFGYIPRNVPSNILDVLKDDEINKLDPNPIARINEIDINKQYKLFSVSWEKIIYIYVLKFIKNNLFQDLILVGHYCNSTVILRMGFISNSIIYIYDVYKSFKVLNTGLMTPGDIILNDEHNVIPQINKKHKPELNDIKMDDQFLFQSFVKDLSEKIREIKLPTYNNFIINQFKTLYILTKKNFSFGKLLNWEQSINNLRQEGEWMEALTLGLDIYMGKNISFPDIPIDENGRKIKVGSTLKGMILHYCIINTENGDLNNCLDICIEFCILINDIDYLINKVKPIFDNKDFSENFIQKLEPFILNDNMKNQNIGYDALKKICDYYIKKNNIDTLNSILSHLNLSCFDSGDIIDICVKYKFITPLIEIYMNNKKEKYFEPILKIYNIFIQSKEIENDKFISYENALKNIPLNELINSKQYIGDKLLWYINLCVDGIKFPNKEIISGKKYEFLIHDIFVWMIKKKNLTELINFDSLSVFTILTKFFNINAIFTSLFTLEYDPKQFEGIIYHNEQINNTNIYLFLNIIIEIAQSINKSFVQYDLYYFIIQISSKMGKLENEIILKAAKFFINIESKIDELNKEKDNFGFRNKNFSNEEIIKLSKEINEMINHSNLILKENDYRDLLQTTEKTSFILVKINLLKLLNEDLKCLNVFLTEYTFEDKIKKTFDFIDETFRKYKNHKQEKFEEFKNECMKQLNVLCELSSLDLYQLIINWFENNQSLVLEKLSTNKLNQLNYLEKVLASYKEDYLPIEDKEIEVYQNLLILHIDLLCECNKTNEILPNLKKRSLYPSECLDKFIKYEVHDACIYFYILQNNLEDALKLSNNLLIEGIQKIKKDLKENEGKNFDSLTIKHEENLNRSINICQQDFIDDEIREKSWFKLVKICYDFRNDIKDIKNKNLELNNLIGNNIQKVFESMYSYVKVTKIMSTLTDENKGIEYKEFKPILIKMLNGFTHSRKILELCCNIFTINIIKDEKEFYKISKNGNLFQMNKCDYCNNNIKVDDIIIFFKCGHKIHFMCSIKEDDLFICSVCRKKEIENAITSNHDKEKKISKPSEKEIEDYFTPNNNNEILNRTFYRLSMVNKELLHDNLKILNFNNDI